MIKKMAREDIVLKPITGAAWHGSNIAEVFDCSGRTKMACGIHEIFKSETIVENPPVDDVLFILEGEMAIESDGKVVKFRTGDFAYLPAGARQKFIVAKHVKHIYVAYPSNWKEEVTS